MTDPPGEESGTSGQTLHLLLVEDHDGDARLLAEALREARFEALELHRVEALAPAVEWLGENPVDIVLLDLSLPDARGLETLQRILAADGSKPVVVFTDPEDQGVALKALREGAQDYVVKGSLDPQQLERALRHSVERKRSERAARRTRRVYRTVFEAAPIGMAMVDADLRIVEANRALCEMLGYSKDELVGTPYAEVTHDDDVREDVELARRLFAGEIHDYRMEKRYVTRGGDVIWGSLVVSALEADEDEPRHALGMVRDITSEKESRKALRQSEERLARVLETVAEGIVIVDPDGRFTYVNPGAERILGRNEKALLGTTYRDSRWNVTAGEGTERAEEDYVYRQVLESGEAVRGAELQLEHPRRGRIILSLNAAPLHDASGEMTGVVISLRDVTEQKRFEEELERRALYDGLTGLPNRALFWDRLLHAVQRSERGNQQLAVLFADLDRFKMVNDSLGHDAGDRALMETARRMRRTFRDEDTVARIGGDEFTVLMEDVTDSDDALAAAERLVEEFERPFRIHDEEFHIYPSVGIAIWSSDTETPDDVVRRADAAMYRARRSSGTRVHLFDPEADVEHTERLQREARLHTAVESRTVVPFYQPIVDLETGDILGVESLARWRDPERGLVEPPDFIPLAEESGLILDLGEQLIREACRDILDWEASGFELELFVNLSAQQFDSPQLIPFVEELLEDSGLRPSRLHVEVTERVIMQSAERLDALKELGLSVAVDDFGTGYSSLGYLRRLNVDGLKIDRVFISGVDHRLPDEAIVRTIVTLGDTLGLDVTAEGIEEEAQAERLRDLGCRRGQGFHFARPMPAADLEDLLSGDAALPA